MQTIRLFALLAILLTGALAARAQDASSDVAITLERTACFGSCPIYSVTILTDGTIIYEGERFVDVTGKQTDAMEPEMVELMVDVIRNAGYFEWDEAYNTRTVTDLPSVITSVTDGGEAHRIERYTGDSAPLALPYLEHWIDMMANTSRWTGADLSLNTVWNGGDGPIVTLERGHCFGFCPVYSVALYADGTGIYTGIANVGELGVRVFDAEPAAVDSVLVRAESFGYFDWQDSYEHQVMTDQETVVTSIQLPDQHKRIVRYAGDPNAPVGLVYVEDIIAMFVDDYVG